MRSELAQKQSEQLDAYLQALRNQLNSQRQREAERALESTELLAENSETCLPVSSNSLRSTASFLPR
jgi:potassium efflux system protein